MTDTWQNLRIEDVCEVVDCQHKTAPTVDYKTPFKMLRTTNIRNGFIDGDNVNYVTEDTYEEWSVRGKLKRGDIILTREAPMGEVGIIKTDDKFFLGQRLLQLKANENVINAEFLFYSLCGPLLQNQIRMHDGVGSVVSNLRIPDLKNFTVRVPDRLLQDKIADILGSLDDKIQLNRRMNETLEQMVIALYQHWFIDFGPFAEFDDNELPVGWRWGTLKEVGYVHKVQVDPSELEETRPYIGLEHMPKGNTSLEDWESSDKVTSHKSMFDKGDILFGKLRPYFKKVGVAPIDGVCSTDILVLKPVNKEFFGMLFGLVIQDAFIDYCTNTSGGTKMPRSDWKEMAKYSVPIPPESVREEFNQKISTFVDQIISNIHANRTLIEIRDYMLPRLLSGEIEVKVAEEQVEEVLAGA